MGKRRKRKRRNKWSPEKLAAHGIDERLREEIQTMLGEMGDICRRLSKGPGTEEFSVKCVLAALNGNFPRIRKQSLQKAREGYLAMRELHGQKGATA